jgi:hypothetical protein
MADLKISALTASTTPLAGTEVLPIVQSSTTKQVSVANLTAGRAVSASSLTASTGDITATAGNLVFGASGKGIVGTATNNNADTGNVGQYIESVVTSTTSTAANSAYFDVTSITLTAGDWDVSAILVYVQNGALWTRGYLAISPNAGDTGAGTTQGSNLVLGIWASSVTTPSFVSLTIPTYRISIASTTTYYLKGNAFYSAGTPQYSGARISARRVR